MSAHTPGPHAPTTCQRTKDQPIYCGKGYKAKFACPQPGCGRSTYQSLNFLGRRLLVCDGAKFTKEARDKEIV